ncbi:ubiquitin carboxyl-terminal hydrolase 1-like [Stylophora pistillata]|uniref:Ubiquitin carboxyl-terminal hydrolase n=1 Tax=Stylophora pistillata TaxID=50429 RepID=A0A2B4SLN6_STYPI|nr:ubiquitin carboxyl-terminal hydrolase 1-like [Stylophora pistillata]PFX29498.1 Ubiquitin carboxyl-terminal hydrolase 1 [Stylophora pistillata]
MSTVFQTDSPPLSPRSPPRKRTKFSLKLKNKKSLSEIENREKLHPIFSPSTSQNTKGEDAFEPPIPPPPFAGLKNLGNICYANAVLQVLRFCPGLLQSVMEIDSLVRKLYPSKSADNEQGPDKDIDPCDNTGNDHRPVVCKLKELFSEMKEVEMDYCENKENCDHLVQRRSYLILAAKPSGFMEMFRKQNPMFEGNQQHDAQEFLCSLLVNLQDTENDVKKKTEDTPVVRELEVPFGNSRSNNRISKHVSPVEELFQGRLLHQTKCMTCEEAKKRFENFQDISVPVQQEPKVYDANTANTFSPTPKKGQDGKSLSWALSQFARIEHLTGENKYFCDNCLTHTEAEISTCFDQLPNILIIHLKRFTANASLGFLSSSVSKITSNLETPMELSVKEWCSKSCPLSNPTYHLFGIVMHSGMTSCSGHYQAYVQVPKHHHYGNAQVLSSDKGKRVDSYEPSTAEFNSHSFSSVSEKSVGYNSFLRDEKPDKIQAPSPENSAEKVKITCISGITKFFHKSKKHSTSEGMKHSTDEGTDEGNKHLAEKCRNFSTPTLSCTGTKKSVSKIHSFQYQSGTNSHRSAIRQLNFQQNDGQLHRERQRQGEGQMPHTCRSVTETEEFQWIHFDDAEVRTIEESDVKTLLSSSESSFTSPYLLFYKLAESYV